MKTLKSIGAVLAGFITVVILSVLTDSVLEKTGFFSTGGVLTTKLLIVATIYRGLYSIVGGYVTAILAPSNPMKHVKILAAIGLLAGIAGVIGGWNLSAHWYPIAVAITGPLLTLVGGKLKK